MSDEPTKTRALSEPTQTRIDADETSARPIGHPRTSAAPPASDAPEPTRTRTEQWYPTSDATEADRMPDPTEAHPDATEADAIADLTAADPSPDVTAARPPAARPSLAEPTEAEFNRAFYARTEASETSTPAMPPSPHAQLAAASAAEIPFGEGYALRDRYQLLEMIGKGAMGQVWKAHDRLSAQYGNPNPYVAIKVLTSDYETHPRAFQAMEREARRARDLAHPNIATVHVFDKDDRNGRTFIAMDLLVGRTIDRAIRDTGGRGLPREEAMRILRAIASALAYAHEKGVVHSDLKPANIFLTDEGVPKLLDFGIARAARSEGAAKPIDDGVMSGYTITYAAPEVIADEPPHTSDDVFALGIVAYELLTGHHPFARKPADQAVREGLRPQPIKGLTRREWRTIERALAFERAKRWPDAQSFLRALQGITRLQIGLAASVVVMAIVAGVFWYRSYVATRPAVPFDQLPVAEQQYIRRALDSGNEALDLVRRSQVIEATADAADYFADAYAHHPRNPEAVAGLDEAADHFIEWAQRQPDRTMVLRELRNFQQKSPYYTKYGPLESAIAKVEAP